MKIKKMIFDDIIDGHHLEYIHHLYMKAGLDINTQYIFSLPKTFNFFKDKYNWPIYENIEFDYIDDLSISNKKENFLLHSFRLCKILKERADFFKVDSVFIISLMSYLPFLPLFVRGIKISGIIYMIYIYRWKFSSFAVKFLDVFKYLLLAKCQIFDKIFLLNSIVAPRVLNNIYKTEKFTYLPDPYLPIRVSNSVNVYRELCIPDQCKIFIHFGSLSSRKGTLEILKAIECLNEDDSSKMAFVFAGVINSDIKKEFYVYYEKLKNKHCIKLIDSFCSYDYLASLCNGCDFILLPYKQTFQSSGLLGYAAQFNKPIIGPSGGMIGRVIRRYNLGVMLNEITPISILKGFYIVDKFDKSKMLSANYLKNNTVEYFQESIFTTDL